MGYRAWKGWANACVGGLILASSVSCQTEQAQPTQIEDDAPPPDESQDTGVACEFHSDCSDGAYCNGEETCFEGTCHLGEPPSCDDGIECTVDSCSHSANGCVFAAPDQDGDGHFDASCEGPDGAGLGDDCDDADPDRYPGNTEICGEDPGHDEDCDPSTFGHLDADLDGVVSDQCCNSDGDDMKCGKDCDDGDYRRYPKHAEICDDIDNDCDGQVDVNTREVPWYPDQDGDNFGEVDGDSILSCAPIEGRSLRPSDCDDGTAAVHIAAAETCDGFDNNCDGEVDEDNVCACAPEGNARPCACSPTRAGLQICAGGLWDECNCDECMTGETDCVAGILPRLCVDGQWEFQLACTGQFSECNGGVCTCPGGGTDCPPDMGTGGSGSGGAGSGGTGTGGAGAGNGPVMVATVPADWNTPVATSSVPGLVFDVGIQADTVSGAVMLYDAFDGVVPGAPTVTGNQVNFVPDSTLFPGMAYRLEVLASVTDLDGDPIGFVSNYYFSTQSELSHIEFSSDPNLSFTSGRLAISPGGTLVSIIREETMSPPSDRSVSRDWNGAGWNAAEQITSDWPANEWEFDVDDAGWVMATAHDGTNLARYHRHEADWVNSDTTPAPSGGATRNLVTLNASGRGFYIFENTSMALELVGRTGGGIFDTGITEAMFGDYDRAVGINPSGVGLASTISGADLFVWHSEADLASFTIENRASNVVAQDSAVGSDGKKYVAYTRDTSSGDPQFELFVQVYDSTWSGEINVIISGTGNEDEPQIGVDSAGNAHVLFRKNDVLTTAMLPSGGNMFLGDIPLSTPNNFGLGNYLMEVAANGDVVVVWTESGQTSFDLWSVSYSIAGGWGVPRLVEDSPDPIGHFDLAVDDSGNAYVLFEVIGTMDKDSFTAVIP